VKLIRLLPFVAAATLLLPAGVAVAQDPTGPGTVACQEANGAVITAKGVLAAKADELGVKSAALADAELNLGRAVDSAKPYFQKLVDDLTPLVAALKVEVPNLQEALDAATAAANEACATDGQPPASPSPSAEPSSPPAAPVDDVDCADVPQARAQEILDADRSDPNKLDGDHDGTACEVDEGEDTVDLTIPEAAPSTSQVSVLPQGGVDTGW
jgi:hypothetical protein